MPAPAPTFGLHCSRFHPHQFTFHRVIAECMKTIFASKYLQYGLFKPMMMTLQD